MNEMCLELEVNDVITYAIYQNGMRIVRKILIKNNSQDDYENLILKIRCDNSLVYDFEQGIESIKSGENLEL